ncbi:unnamed protein product, partial [Rotaria sp. Silwood2]
PLLPLGAYILINCVNDFVNCLSNDILLNVLDRLIIAAGQYKWSVVCPFLLDQIRNTLRKFPHDVISLWINKLLSQSAQHDIQTITALCHFLEGKSHDFDTIQWLDQTSCSILQSLLSLDNENNGFAIDRLLVKIAFSNHQLLPVNPTTLKEFLLDKDFEINSIPMILFPLIITLYGGLKRDGSVVMFDPSDIHRESTAITPMLIRFLSDNDCNKQKQNLKKLKQECIKSFAIRIENHDESLEAVDLCIATICFYNIEYIQENLKMISNSFLRMCRNRLKYISMILRQFYFAADEKDLSLENETTIFISTCIKKFQYVESARIHFLDLLNSLRSSVARLRFSSTSILLEGISKSDKRVTLYLPNSLRKENSFLNCLLTTDMHICFDRKSSSLIYHFTKLFWLLEENDQFDTQYRMAVAMDNIPEYLMFLNNEDLLIPLTFVPSHLRNLYDRLLKEKFITINPRESIANSRQHLYFGSYLTDEERKRVIQDNIEQEYQRLKNASVENDQRNVKLYSASISLARICRWTDDGRKSFLLEQSINGAMSIQNKLARLDALCVIAFYLHSDYDQIRIDRDRSLKKEIEHQFNEIYPTLPLLLQTIIFIRCLPLLQHSKATDDCLQNIINKFANTDQRDEHAVIGALL